MNSIPNMGDSLRSYFKDVKSVVSAIPPILFRKNSRRRLPRLCSLYCDSTKTVMSTALSPNQPEALPGIRQF